MELSTFKNVMSLIPPAAHEVQIKDFKRVDYNFVIEVKGCRREGRKSFFDMINCGGRGSDLEMRELIHSRIRGEGNPWDEVFIE